MSLCGHEAERGCCGPTADMRPAGLGIPPNDHGHGAEGDVDVPLRARGRERVSPSHYRQEAGRGLCRPPAGTRPGEGDIQVPLTDDPREVSFTRAQRRCGHYAPAEPSSRAISPGSFMTGQQKFNAPTDAKPPPTSEKAGLSVAGQASPSARAGCRSDRWAIGAKKFCWLVIGD